jgi:hypothetical protein
MFPREKITGADMTKEWIQGITRKIVTDEALKPVAVQIDYADWLEIERCLELRSEGGGSVTDLSSLTA